MKITDPPNEWHNIPLLPLLVESIKRDYLVVDKVAVHLYNLVVLICLYAGLHLQKFVISQAGNFSPQHFLVKLEQVAQIVFPHTRVPDHHVHNEGILQGVEPTGN